MCKVLVLYHSVYHHVETMARAVEHGALDAGAIVDVRRVPDIEFDRRRKATDPEDAAPHPIARVDELPNYDAIIIGVGTRFGRMSSPMAHFWDQTGGLWSTGALIGKVGAVFTSTGTQHGGQEMTLVSSLASMMHHGFVVTGLPYAFQGQMRVDEVAGGTPYGASTIAGPDGSRSPSEIELEGARFLGGHVAQLAGRLAGSPARDAKAA